MHIVQQDTALRIIGIELRTANSEAMQTIPPHWQRFTQENVLANIPGKLSDEVYAVYTHFENAGLNNQGIYSLIIGAPVSSAQAVPPGMAHAVLPASPRAVFPVPKGQFDQVGPTWQEVWQRDDLPKTFIAECERYRADGQIDILIGLRHGSTA
ncbi:GyrI-like domain-containing protein [Hydrogenophaga sp.]|uniref:GyrI-like domain-containing protein n=1 Tax=Hydrogenophaga sp. TaxID=1904254 RepID=UPI002723D84C|nr:effector binding domain-containing protein [Hydrogenophaga sp.]MDO9434485.1 effector binding domain-containing protein [Hydrogenophaga sp.]